MQGKGYSAKNKLGLGVYNLDPIWLTFTEFDWYVDRGFTNNYILNGAWINSSIGGAEKVIESGGQAWLGCPAFASCNTTLSKYMEGLVAKVNKFKDAGVWDCFVGFNFDEPLLHRATNQDLLDVTKAMHEEFGLRIFPVFSTQEVLGQKGNWNDPDGTLILESFATEYLTDIAFDSYGYDYRQPPTQAMIEKLDAVREKYPVVTDSASYYRFVYDRLKETVENKNAYVWVVPCMYTTNTWAAVQSDEDYCIEHLKGLTSLLFEQQHPGGIMGYTFKSWNKKQPGLDFHLHRSNPNRWNKFENAMREIYDKIKDIDLK